MSERYERVLKFVKEKHKGQVRHSGELVVSHPIGVAEILKEAGYSEEYQMVGLMHDLVEDTDTTIEEMMELVNDESIVNGVISLTKTDGMSLEESIDNAKKDKYGKVIKGADRYQNAKTTYTDKNTQEFISGFIYKSIVFYLPALIEVNNVFVEPLMKELNRLYFEMCDEALIWVNEKISEKGWNSKELFIKE